MTASFHSRKNDYQSTSSLRNAQPDFSENPVPPVPAAEIESLLRSFGQPAIVEAVEELGPGDVQHLRGRTIEQFSPPLEKANEAEQRESLQSIETSLTQTERRLAEALFDSHGEQPVAASLSTNPERSSHQSATAYGLTFDDLGDVELDISIELGRTEILIEEILKLRAGSVVALDRLAGDPVDIIANGRLVARGELLVIEGKFGVRLSEVL